MADRVNHKYIKKLATSYGYRYIYSKAKKKAVKKVADSIPKRPKRSQNSYDQFATEKASELAQYILNGKRKKRTTTHGTRGGHTGGGKGGNF